MYLSHLSLTNFRNFPHLELDLPLGISVISGANAQGKTSLLEAMYLLAIARSFRTENEHEVVNWAASGEGGSALVGGTIEKKDQRLKVYVGYQCVPTQSAPSIAETAPDHHPGSSRAPDRPGFGVRKQIKVSRIRRSASELVGVVNAVLFTAEDIELVHGPPSVRRRFLDILMSQVDRAYLKTLQRYQRVLHQRNRLLKLLQDKRAGLEELDFWDQELSKEGASIVWQRQEALGFLEVLCKVEHDQLTGGSENLRTEYKPQLYLGNAAKDLGELEQVFAEALSASRNKELRLGSTTVGPHRDDFKVWVNNIDMGTYASRGQARTVALTLRLAEAAYLSSARQEEPIVLLDDVLSELDSFRRSHVLEKVSQYQQVVITTTDSETIPRCSLPNVTYFEVQGSELTSGSALVDSA